MIKVGIVGATGYTGVELLRLLIQHPQVHIQVVTSRSEVGTPVVNLFPNLRGHLDITFSDPTLENLAECDVLFFATPNGTAMQNAPELLAASVRIIDLAADFRLKDPAVWRQWYGMEHHCPELLNEAVYGLPEINRVRIAQARLIANPGCYPTAVLLGFLPLLEAGIIDLQHLIADVKSGVSGAGRKASLNMLMAEMGESFKAYNVPAHRHWPEISQQLNDIAKVPVHLTFVPHLLPIVRGIHATLYAQLTDSNANVQSLFEQRYQREPFVDVLPSGSHPETRSVRGANWCRLAVHRPQGRDTVVILSVIDNLVKGAAGQAVQNMNLLFGLPETLGLQQITVFP